MSTPDQQAPTREPSAGTMPTLFELDPLPPASEPEPLSAGRRLTIRNSDSLARGIHPATGQHLARNGEVCATCTHHQHLGWHNRAFHKCAKHRLGRSHSAASDIRIGWPACTLWEAAP